MRGAGVLRCIGGDTMVVGGSDCIVDIFSNSLRIMTLIPWFLLVVFSYFCIAHEIMGFIFALLWGIRTLFDWNIINFQKQWVSPRVSFKINLEPIFCYIHPKRLSQARTTPRTSINKLPPSTSSTIDENPDCKISNLVQKSEPILQKQ